MFNLIFTIIFTNAAIIFGCAPNTCTRQSYCVKEGYKSCFYYQYNTEQLDYYFYMIDIIKNTMNDHNYQYNFILGQDFNYRNFVPDHFVYNITNGLPSLKIGYGYEHTLVRPGGRDTDNSEIGTIPVEYMKGNNNEKYLVRLTPGYFAQMNSFDIVFEYSMGNIINIETSGISKYDILKSKLIYIAPSSTYYNHQPNYYFSKIGRDINSVSTFQYPTGRRGILLESIKTQGIKHINKNGLKFQQLLDLYKTSKILVNIHQTDHHHTLEEFRIVPALLYGCIVIAETVPLIDSIPFHSFILFTSFDNITAVMKDVIQNYDTYWENIFGKRLYDNNSV